MNTLLVRVWSILSAAIIFSSCDYIMNGYFNTVEIDRNVMGSGEVLNQYSLDYDLFQLVAESELVNVITMYVDVEDIFILENSSPTSYSQYIVTYKFDKYHFLYNNWKKSDRVRKQFCEKHKQVDVSDFEMSIKNAAENNDPLYVLACIRLDKDNKFIGYKVEMRSSSLNSIIDYIDENFYASESSSSYEGSVDFSDITNKITHSWRKIFRSKIDQLPFDPGDFPYLYNDAKSIEKLVTKEKSLTIYGREYQFVIGPAHPNGTEIRVYVNGYGQNAYSGNRSVIFNQEENICSVEMVIGDFNNDNLVELIVVQSNEEDVTSIAEVYRIKPYPDKNNILKYIGTIEGQAGEKRYFFDDGHIISLIGYQGFCEEYKITNNDKLVEVQWN